MIETGRSASMSIGRRFTAGIACGSTVLVLSAGIAVARQRKIPLGNAPPIQFQSTSAPDAAVQKFLNGDFVIVKDVKALPRPVLQAFTEVGGSRPVMANPDEKFEETDFITDSSIPRARLIFAGGSGDRCFVHYEQEGRGRSYLLALFVLTGSDTMKPVWRGYCGPTANVRDLRSKLADGCSQPITPPSRTLCL